VKPLVNLANKVSGEKTMSTWTIRPMLITDCNDMFKLHVAAINAIDDSIYTKDIRDSWAFGLTVEGYARAADDGEEYEVAVTKTGEVVAFCGVKNGEVYGLFVDPRFQGLGIGKALYLRGEARALVQNPDAKTLPLSASLCAIPFYEHLGYKEVKRVSRKSRGGLMMDVSEMEKPI
jgi:GNAT superfamily N-acetyltransferase